MSDIKWNLPTKSDPGFLKRKIEIMDLLSGAPTAENLRAQAEYLSQYVEGDNPADQVLNASEDEIGHALLSLMGMKSTVTDPKGESSEQA